jgi:multiple sugar transport system substrate-binding protein
MTPETPAEGRSLSRRRLLEAGLGLGIGAALPAGAAAATRPAKRRVQGASKSLVIGAFEDGALVPFKQKIIPLFKHQTGISIELLQEPYTSFFAKAFADGQTKAGQYDIYIMDDPWVPQYAAAGILENLGKHGVKADKDYARPFIELGYWPPRSGPRIKGFTTASPQLIALPTIGDLQTMTYRKDIFGTAPKTWTELVTKATAAQKAGKIKYGYAYRGVKTNPIVTSWYPIFLSFGGQFFDQHWNVTFNNAAGKAAAKFFLKTLRAIAPPGVAEFDSDQEGAAILGGQAAAVVQYTGNAIKSNDPKQSKEVGKLKFATVPKQKKAIAQIGIFIHGVSASAPNKDNAITFMKWYGTNKTQVAVARAGDVPVKVPALKDHQAAKGHPIYAAALKQLLVGAEPRPRTPDWSQVETYLGTELNKALVAGQDGSAALDNAAKQSTAYLKRQGYYT